MTERAKNCCECKHWKVDHFHTGGVCLRGHRPRFYKPRHESDTDWGWRRRCADYEAREVERG